MLAELVLRLIGTTDWCVVNYRATSRGPFTTLFLGKPEGATRFFGEKTEDLMVEGVRHSVKVEL